MACRALTALLVISAQRAAADYDAAVAEGILTSLELELKLPWMTVDFDTEVIASGAAMKENYTLVDPDILQHALFAGIKAAGDAVRASPLLVMSFELRGTTSITLLALRLRVGCTHCTGFYALRGNRSWRTVLWLLQLRNGKHVCDRTYLH